MPRYESPDESCYSESASSTTERKKRRPRRKAGVEAVGAEEGKVELATSTASLASMDPDQQEDFVASLRSTVRRLQEKECSFEASDPMEEAGEDL